MKYYGKKSMSSILNIVLTITLIIGVIATGAIFYNTFFNMKEEISALVKFLVALLLIVGINCVFLIVFQLKKVVQSLVNADPFIASNVVILKRVAIECYTIAGCYIVNFLVNSNLKEFQFAYVDNKGIHTDMEFIIFLFAGCFISILSNVFKQAVEFKEENDSTI